MSLKSFVLQDKEYHIITANNSHLPPYWQKLTKLVTDKYGISIKPENVLAVLEDSFNFYANEMTELLRGINDVSFFFFVHNLHEQTSELSYSNQGNYQIPVDYKYYAAYRRILKMILQESCFCDATFGRPVTPKWMLESVTLLEKLIYLGDGILTKVDAISLEKMAEGSVEITFENGMITFGNTPDWQEFIPLFHEDFPEQNENSIIDERLQTDFDLKIY